MNPPPADAGFLRKRLLWAGLAALACMPFLAALDGPFVYDDKVEVIGNRAIRVFENWRAVLGYNVSRPLLVLSYAFDWERAGLEPRAYHVTSLVIHALSVGSALFFADATARLFGLTRPLLRAAVAVGLWAVHPMVAESVVYITGRSEALCGAFVFLSLGAHAEAVRAERAGGAGLGWRMLALLGFMGGVLSKELAVMLPFAQVALEVASSSRSRGAAVRDVRWLGYLPVVGVVLAAVALRWRFLGETASVSGLIPHEVDRPLGAQLVTSAEVWLHYARLWVLPVGQTLFHDQSVLDPASLRGVGAVVGWAVLLAGTVLAWRRWPVAGALLVCAGLFLIPSSSIARLKEPMAEHRAYQTGLYMLAAAAFVVPEAWLGRMRPRVGIGVLVVVLMGASHQRAKVWSSEVALWREAAAVSPGSADAWFGLGDAHRFAKDCTAAIPAYTRALELAEDDPEVTIPRRLDALNNLGICHAQIGDGLAAKKAWLGALELRPSYCRAHTNLGSLAYRQRHWEAALIELRSALAYCPDNPTAHWLAGNIYYGPLRDPQKALVHYEALIRIAPRFDFAPEAKERILELTW